SPSRTPRTPPRARLSPVRSSRCSCSPSSGGRPTASDVFGELLARERLESLTGRVVGAERLLVGVLRIRGDLLGDRTDFRRKSLAVVRLTQQRVDPGLRTVVGRKVAVEQELPQHE